jgi:hypothetical protein
MTMDIMIITIHHDEMFDTMTPIIRHAFITTLYFVTIDGRFTDIDLFDLTK